MGTWKSCMWVDWALLHLEASIISKSDLFLGGPVSDHCPHRRSPVGLRPHVASLSHGYLKRGLIFIYFFGISDISATFEFVQCKFLMKTNSNLIGTLCRAHSFPQSRPCFCKLKLISHFWDSGSPCLSILNYEILLRGRRRVLLFWICTQFHSHRNML